MSDEESSWKRITGGVNPGRNPGNGPGSYQGGGPGSYSPGGPANHPGNSEAQRTMAIPPARKVEDFLSKAPSARKGKARSFVFAGGLLVLGVVAVLCWVGYTTIVLPRKAPASTSSTPDVAGQGAPGSAVSTLAGVTLPASLVVTEPVMLLDAAGKEVTIPVNVVIRVSNRSEKGTLSMTINNRSFVGNEERVAGKVKYQSRVVVK